MGKSLPRSLFGGSDEEQYDRSQPSTCILPSKEASYGYLQCYFEHASITYRYISEADTYLQFEELYAEPDGVLQDDAEMAKLLFIMGIGYEPTHEGNNWNKANRFKLHLDCFVEERTATAVEGQSVIHQSLLGDQSRGTNDRIRYRLLRAAQSYLQRIPDTFSPPLALLQAYVLKVSHGIGLEL